MSTMTVSAPGAFRGSRPASSGRSAASGVARRPAAPAHLTRRGRLLLTSLAVVLLAAMAVLAAGGLPALAGDSRPVQRVTVAPGETLWQIAGRVAPGADPRETIAAILDLNHLRTVDVQAGTALIVP